LLAPESSLGDHDTAQEHYSRGAQLLAEGKDGAAEAEFRTSWLTEPRNPSYVRSLALFYIQRRRYEDALDVLRDYVNSCGATAPGYELEAELLFQQRIYSSALNAAERSLALNDKSARMHELVGLVYVADRQNGAAITELAKETELDPHNPQIRYWYGRTLYTTGRPRDALEQFLACLKIQPYYPRALENLGLCYEALQDDSKAIEAYENAIAHEAGKSGPKDVEPYAYYAVLLNKRGQRDRGLELLREAVRLNPDSFRVNYELGRLLLAERDRGGAEIYLQRAMSAPGECFLRTPGGKHAARVFGFPDPAK
jgi:tetratricopeptide (TPR) repeat protein